MSLNRILNSITVGACLYLFMAGSSSMTNYQDTPFRPYIAEFTRYSNMANPKLETKIKNISVVFGKVDKNSYAEWYIFRNTVYVNKENWERLLPVEREELIFHELGHAILGLDHSDNTIMQAVGLLGKNYYPRHYSDLLNIHFGCIPIRCIDTTYRENKYDPQSKEKQVTLAEVLQNEHAVIRFTATWCPPCKALAPVFDEVAAAHPDVKTYIVDVDKNPDLARDLNVRGIPTCMAIRNKAVSEALVGNQPKPEIEKLFK